ncbi:guanine deaminase [Pedobacter sp. UYEF25]
MEHTDEEFMQMAIALAAKNLNGKNGGPFGAVVAKNGKLISKSENLVKSTIDATAHAEIMAIRIASKQLNSVDLSDCILYTSCEPCPMCLAAIYWSNITKVYFASAGIDASKAGFDDQVIYRELSEPIEKRKLPMIELLKIEGNEVFEAWKKKH